MSSTDLYTVNLNGDVQQDHRASNSFAGAFFIWDVLAKRYLGESVGSFMSSPEKMQKVWDLAQDSRVIEHDRYVLISTFDKVVVWHTDLKRFEGVLQEFIADQATENLIEQLGWVQRCAARDDILGITWNQTSVNGMVWWVELASTKIVKKRRSSKRGHLLIEVEPVPYNIFREKDHLFLFQGIYE